MQQPKSLSAHLPWEMATSDFLTPRKAEDDQMLHLDELIEQHAYDDSPLSSLNSPPTYSSPTPQSIHPPSSAQALVDATLSSFRPSGNLLLSSRNGSVSVTKPIPPPASFPRKQDPSTMNQRVVHPSKESCYNLPIMVPSIPEGGTKSRVETQVRVTVDLADASSSSDPYKYDRVGSWQWLKLPPGTATKKRTRKQGKIDPDPQDILHLSATVTCASPPHNRVLSCSSCQTREARRVAKKLAARVRPARSDSESGDDRHAKGKQTEDTTSIIQFNCAEVLDFSTGSVVLPLRITCYCRHHREKVGFNVHFTMMDHQGRIVGTGSSRPIMITDDHKTAPSANATRQADFPNGFMNVDSEWPQASGTAKEISPEARAPSKRKQDTAGKRPKPYDSTGKPNRVSRESSVVSQPSPSTTPASLPMTRSPTPAVLQQMLSSDAMVTQQQPPPLQYSSNGSESSSPSTLVTPLDRSPDINIPDPHQLENSHAPSPLSLPTTAPSVVMPTHPHPMPFMFFDPLGAQMPMQLPLIHRLIPSMGPTHGGIEVTILGANFHPSLQLNCVFGDVAASSTQRWSDNTLVCVLPPRAMAGVVAVWFDGFPKMLDQTNAHPSLFTYADESDRALMELALQVVGLKMTGKIEDAKNVAMRIVGGADNSDSQHGNNSNMMQLASSISTRDLRPLLLSRAGDSENFESVLIDFLKVLDTPLDHRAPSSISTPKAISHATSSGQTLLHLSAFLGFSSLLSFLVKHGIDVDVRDRNGYTALHFAVFSKSEACVRILLDAGADREIVNALGKTPAECSTGMEELFGDATTEDETSDEEAQWGDAEEESVTPIRLAPGRRASRRNLRHGGTSGRNTPLLTRSLDISRAATPPPSAPNTPEKSGGDKIPDQDGVDAKQNAWFIEMIQRTLAQFPAAQGIIPTIPQLPLPQLPHLPHLPGMPAVPWGALPQIPMVFPVYVPMMPGWPAFLGGEQDVAKDGTIVEGTDAAKGVGAGAIRTAQELRAIWEKWFALAIATARQEDLPPPVYTPREAKTEESATGTEVPQVVVAEGEASTSEATRPIPSTDIRPIGYKMASVPDQDINAYGYQPGAKQTQKLQKKLARRVPDMNVKRPSLQYSLVVPPSSNSMPKRGAENELNKDNADHEEEDDEPTSGFVKAKDEDLVKRRIAGLPRRSQSAARIAPPNPPPTSQFTGFSNPISTSTPSSGAFGTFSQTVAPTATSTAKSFASFLEPSSTTLPKSSPSPALSGTSVSPTPDDPAFTKYYTSLRGLNIYLLEALSEATERDPFVDVSDVLERYNSIRLVVQTEFEKTKKPTPPVVPTLVAPAPPSGAFTGFGNFGTSSAFSPTSTASSNTTGGFTPKPTAPSTSGFSFSIPSTNAPTPSSTLPLSAGSSSLFGSSTPGGSNTFAVPSSDSSPFSFKPSPAADKNTPSSSPFTFGSSSTASGTAPTSSFSFGTPPSTSNSSAFSFGTTSNTSTSTGTGASSSIFGSTGASSNIFGSGGTESSATPKTQPFGSFGKPVGSAGNIGNPVGFGFGASSKTPDAERATPDSLDNKENGEGSQASQGESVASEGSQGLITKNPHDEEGEGEEDESTVHDARSKVFQMDTGSSSWVDLGVGVLRIKKHKETGARRILLRNSGTGKIILNFKLYSGLKPTQSKKSLTFVGHDEKGASQTYTVRLQGEEAATALKEVFDREVASL
ncbi:hypothetical protein DXG01_005029 [Tephrocybe rancida]|nr:hypothetical protein DXG01_005029 [Tephrocybe rancida]